MPEYLDDLHDVFFVLSGRVKVTFYAESGREIDFRDLQAGESFGELSAIDGKPRSASAWSPRTFDATVAVMTAPDFLGVLLHPERRIATLRKLTMLVRSLSERVQEQAERVEVRICHERCAWRAAPCSTTTSPGSRPPRSTWRSPTASTPIARR